MNENEFVDISQLPKASGWSKPGVTLYQGCWVLSQFLLNIITFQKQYKPSDHDVTVILGSNPKTGTTWTKALLFSILNRTRYNSTDTPLLIRNPHSLVPLAEGGQITNKHTLFSTHISFPLLPESVVGKCKIVYICRNPLDTITSFWKFATSGGYPDSHGPGWTMEDCVETFSRGESIYGPFWEHVLGFWKASLEASEKVLFLKYEEMLEDTASHVKRIAEFVGFPFSEEEQKSGKVEEIIELCSLRNLKELDTNKHGSSTITGMEFRIFFRKGQVGDWVNHLSPSMVEKVKKVIEEKLQGTGLTFKYSLV